MINETSNSHYPYQGPLGEVVRHGRTFYAMKNGFLVATSGSLEEAVASLAWKGRIKARGYRVAP